MAENKIYFWLKLKKDFFKRHDIRIIESMENGKEFILFYLKLLCESVDHDGNLRFSESIPYTADMLASITNTKKDIVAEALKVFEQLELLEIQDDGTFYMTKVPKMIGSETDWARKKRDFRQKKQDDEDNERTNEGQVEDITRTNEGQKKTLSDKSKSKSKSIEKDIDIKKKKELSNDNSEKEKVRFIPPTIEEVKAYCEERHNNIDPEYFVAFYESKGWMVGKNKMKSWKSAVITWEKNSRDKGGVKNGKSGNTTTKQYTDEQLERFAELL
jgi:predicted phage replisome organizer